MHATAVPLTHSQRVLLAEAPDAADEAALRAHAGLLADRVVLLVRHRVLVDRDLRSLEERALRVAAAVRHDPTHPDARAALWSLVESITHRPWGMGAQAALDRLVVAGAIGDALASA